MEESRDERLIRFANMHSMARIDADKSQDYVAQQLGVSKKTVQNWEKGISTPSFFDSLEWFRVLHLNPFPYYLEYVYGTRNDTPTDEKVEEEFSVLMKALPTKTKRAMLFIFFGRHGSSPISLVDLTLAHIHTPLSSRVINAINIKHNYEMAEARGELICQDNVMPDMEQLEVSINEGKTSAINNEFGYVSIKREDK